MPAALIEGRKVHLLDALDALSRVGSLVEAMHMMADSLLERAEVDAFQQVAEQAHEQIKQVRVALGDDEPREGV